MLISVNKGSSTSGWYAPPKGTHTGEKHRAVGSGKAGAKWGQKVEPAKPRLLSEAVSLFGIAEKMTAPSRKETIEAKEDPYIPAVTMMDYEVVGSDMRDGTLSRGDNYNNLMLVAERLKDSVASSLANDPAVREAGLSYDDVNNMIHQWADSSNDTNVNALEMQRSASKLFGSPLSSWQLAKLGETRNDVPRYMSREHKAVLEAMYNHTQADLLKEGYGPDDTILLFRGVRGMPAVSPTRVPVKVNALSSYSSNYNTADSFGDVLAVNVPVRNILSTPRTGFGCLSESEFVVIGAPDTEAFAAYAQLQ